VKNFNFKPNKRQLQIFGLASLVLSAGMGTLVFATHKVFGYVLEPESASTVAISLWILSLYCILAVAILPGALLPLYVVLTALTLPIGYVMSYFVMGVIYFFVLTPIALICRLARRDPMNRKFEPEISTYWVPRETTKDIVRYFRQF